MNGKPLTIAEVLSQETVRAQIPKRLNGVAFFKVLKLAGINPELFKEKSVSLTKELNKARRNKLRHIWIQIAKQ